MRKQPPSPTTAMSIPAREGPTRRAPLRMEELSAMGFGRSLRSSTISSTNACRAGESKAFTTPWRSWSAATSPTVMAPASVSAARANDCSIESACVTTRTRWRECRSTNTPAMGESIVGARPQNPMTPSIAAEPVRRYTSQLVAMRVSQVPTSETLWPAKKSR